MRLEGPDRAVGRSDLHRHRLIRGHLGQAPHRDAVVLAYALVVGRVGERQRQHPLLLEVGLVDAGEAAGQGQHAAPEPGLHGGVLPAGALAGVGVADEHPAQAGLVVLPGDVGQGLDLAGDLVLAVADVVAVETVDHAQVQVPGDVL